MALAQDSTMANSTRTQLSTDSLSLFPDNTSQLITPADLRNWITSGIESFVTQKDKSTFENAFYECQSSPITATSGTTNLALATGNFVHITGSGSISITSFGTLPAGSRFVLCFDIAVTLVYNATTMILPGAANIVTAPGDSVMIISEGGGNWRLIGYFPSSGLPVGTVTAVTASAPLSSTGSNAPDISISKADATTDGYLDSGDFATFSGKQDALTLTTSGSSGPATLTGATLNIPQYTGGTGTVTSVNTSSPLTGGPITGSGTIGIQDAAADGTTKGAATFASSDFNSSSGVISIDYANGQEASASQDGFLSQGDWTIFNNKQAALTLTTTGSSGPATLTGATLNIPQYSGGTGGTPGGSNTQLQYNNAGSFGGVPNATWDGTNLTLNTPRFGQSLGNGHFSFHRSNSVPSGATDYLTIFWNQANKDLGLRFEQDGFESYIRFGATTSDKTYTLPDASGNVVIDTTVPSFSNGASEGEVRFKEAGGSDYIGLKAPTSVATPVTFTLPSSDGTSGYSLITNGSGQLSWAINGASLLGKRVQKLTQATINNTGAVYTFLDSMLIPAGTYTTGDVIQFNIIVNKTSAAAGLRCYLNTTPSVGGISFIPAQAIGNGTTGYHYGGIAIIFSSTETILNSNLATATNPRLSNPNINWSINQYFVLEAFTGGTISTSVTTNLTSFVLL